MSAMWVTGAQALVPSMNVFPGPLEGIWLKVKQTGLNPPLQYAMLRYNGQLKSPSQPQFIVFPLNAYEFTRYCLKIYFIGIFQIYNANLTAANKERIALTSQLRFPCSFYVIIFQLFSFM